MRTLLITAALLAVALSGCTSSDGTGSASVYVKDAPTDDFAEIHVAFTKVEVHMAGNGDDNGTEDDNGTAGWVTLFENATAQDVNLLNASGDKAFFLGEANLTAGRYTQIRVHATEAYGIDADGNRTDFSLSTNVLKIVKSFEVEDGMETRIVIDFDLDRSIKTQGPNGYHLTPVVGKTHTEIVEDDESGEEVAEEGEVQEVTVE